jgi:hypothetical protein
MPRLKTKTYHFKEKNMSRTPGAKDKKPRVRKIKMTSAQVNLAAKLGVPLETYAKELVKARKHARSQFVNLSM